VEDIYSTSQFPTEDTCEGIEMVWLNVQVNEHKSFIVGSPYRHPSAPLRLTLEFIEKTLKSSLRIKKILLCFL
jgi:hypothetical protein